MISTALSLHHLAQARASQQRADGGTPQDYREVLPQPRAWREVPGSSSKAPALSRTLTGEVHWSDERR